MKLTIEEALRRASFSLRAADIDSPRREAEALLCASLRRPLSYLYAHPDDMLSKEESDLFMSWAERRAAGEPFAYLCGEREFMGLIFYTAPGALIPRPETEILVEAVADSLKTACRPHILEVGTGSGAIAVSLAVLLPDARVTACDISPAALAVAARNTARHRVGDRVRLLSGDLYAPVEGEKTFFTAVVSNPPYVSSLEMPGLPATVRGFEPALALDGGYDGLDYYRRLTAEIGSLTHRPDLLAFEVGKGQAATVAGLCVAAGYENTCRIHDLAGIERVVTAYKAHTAFTVGPICHPSESG